MDETSKSTTPPLCKDCKWFAPTGGWSSYPHQCAHPSVVSCVTGFPVVACTQERAHFGSCGPNGRNFERASECEIKRRSKDPLRWIHSAAAVLSIVFVVLAMAAVFAAIWKVVGA